MWQIHFHFYFHCIKLQSKLKATEGQLLRKLVPEKQIPAGGCFFAEKKTNKQNFLFVIGKQQIIIIKLNDWLML